MWSQINRQNARFLSRQSAVVLLNQIIGRGHNFFLRATPEKPSIYYITRQTKNQLSPRAISHQNCSKLFSRYKQSSDSPSRRSPPLPRNDAGGAEGREEDRGGGMNRNEKMCGISKSDFEFPHIADIKHKLSVLNNTSKVPSGPRFSKRLLFCKNTYFLHFSAKNSYQSVGAIRPTGRFDQHLPQHDWPSCPRKCGNPKSNFEIPHIADIKQKLSRYCELCRKRIKVLNRGILLLWI